MFFVSECIYTYTFIYIYTHLFIYTFFYKCIYICICMEWWDLGDGSRCEVIGDGSGCVAMCRDEAKGVGGGGRGQMG